jgi:ribosomal protein S3
VKILKTDTLILLFLLTGCSSRVTLQFVSGELDRVAISHNENFRPTYLECQSIISELADAMEASDTREGVLDISVLIAWGKLKHCSEKLSDDGSKMEKKIEDFRRAAHHLN